MPFLVASGLLSLLSCPAHAANFNVTNTANSGAGSLRQAIISANAASGADTITITTTGQINLSGQLDVTDSVTITGPNVTPTTPSTGVGIVIDGGALPIFSISGVTAGTTVNISGLQLQNGQSGSGGAIFANSGVINVSNCLFMNNVASLGGALYINVGTMNVTNCIFSNNRASDFGGGAINNAGVLNISGSAFVANQAVEGGGVANYTPNSGGASLNQTLRTSVTNSTFSTNTASTDGGGAFNLGGLLRVDSSTFTLNTAPVGSAITSIGDNLTLTPVNNSFLVNKNGNESDVAVVSGSEATIISEGYNLVGGGNALALNAFNKVGDVTGTNGPASTRNANKITRARVYLNPIADNGGPTPTHALVSPNPAINGGKTALTTDQRGQTRPSGIAADIGAFEFKEVPFPNAPSGTDSFRISEYRASGPNGATDEYIELYNASGAPLSLNGYTIVAGNTNPGTVIYNFPASGAPTIPMRGYYLLAGSGYSLSSVAGANATFIDGSDIPTTGGIGVVSNGQIMDKVGVAGFVDGNRVFTPPTDPTSNYAYVRQVPDTGNGGSPLDTDNNRNDFKLVSTDSNSAVDADGAPRLGAPGPQPLVGDLTTPVQANGLIAGTTLLPTTRPSTIGVVPYRRRLQNKTSSTYTINSLQVRVTNASAGTGGAPGTSDVRLQSGTGVTGPSATLPATGSAGFFPLTLAGPAQPNGGGFNSLFKLPSAVTLAPGESVDVEFLLDIRTAGNFSVFFNYELTTVTALQN